MELSRMAKKKKVNLKKSNPIEYYKKRRAKFKVLTMLSSLVPPISILVVYAVVNSIGGVATPLNPARFSIGMALLVIGIVLFTTHTLKNVTKENKRTGQGALYTTAIVWAYMGLVLWLLYLSMFYLILLCISEFVSCSLGAYFASKIQECNGYIEKNANAELQAKAFLRVQKNEDDKTNGDSIPTE